MKSKSKKKQSKRKAIPPAAEIVVENTRELRARPVVLRREPVTLARVLGETTVVVPARVAKVTAMVVRKPAKKSKRAA